MSGRRDWRAEYPTLTFNPLTTVSNRAKPDGNRVASPRLCELKSIWEIKLGRSSIHQEMRHTGFSIISDLRSICTLLLGGKRNFAGDTRSGAPEKTFPLLVKGVFKSQSSSAVHS